MRGDGAVSGLGYSLTARQRELLVYLTSRDTCPSYEEMQRALGLASKSGVYRLIQQLEERGYIRRIPHLARAIEVIRTFAASPEVLPAPPTYFRSCCIHIPLHGRID